MFVPILHNELNEDCKINWNYYDMVAKITISCVFFWVVLKLLKCLQQRRQLLTLLRNLFHKEWMLFHFLLWNKQFNDLLAIYWQTHVTTNNQINYIFPIGFIPSFSVRCFLSSLYKFVQVLVKFFTQLQTFFVIYRLLRHSREKKHYPQWNRGKINSWKRSNSKASGRTRGRPTCAADSSSCLGHLLWQLQTILRLQRTEHTIMHYANIKNKQNISTQNSLALNILTLSDMLKYKFIGLQINWICTR